MSVKIYKDNLSDVFYIMKAFAILTVIFAHCSLNTTNYFTGVYKNIGTIGVGIFLFIAGFYFKQDMDFISFGKKFIKTFIPWSIASSAIWLEVSIRKGNLNIFSFLQHLMGNSSIFYFFTIYFAIIFISTVLFNKLKINCTVLCLSSVVVNIIFNLLENYELTIFPTPLLNPFVFISYFMVGHWFSKHIELLVEICNSSLPLLGGVAFLIMFIPKFITYYWNGILEIILEFSIIGFNFFLARLCFKFKDKFITIGKNTLFIYIWHLIPMTLINFIGNKCLLLQRTFIFWPLICFCIMLFSLGMLRKINMPRLKQLLGVVDK